eukprot:TRINITY_DN3550_c0_g1_i1.p1 TRINITY_DN3550_c0_g1~~TRINITY_DN3550_c0_g1_i1.p1  ORF type:complete len:247 (-),score=16.60 TRINITY_DN3550_c0_g1_i1:5-745(-)
MGLNTQDSPSSLGSSSIPVESTIAPSGGSSNANENVSNNGNNLVQNEDDGEPPETCNGHRVTKDGELQFDSPPLSHINPKVRCMRSPHGAGLFAIRPICKDELLVGWAGKVVHVTEIIAMEESERTYILQIDEELFQVPPWEDYNEAADFVNHSCQPNAGFGTSSVSLVAMRDIEIGEEITFDYAMAECCEGLKGNEFECRCATPSCRGAFTGGDWKNPILWEKYQKYFSPYLRKKIKALKRQLNA